LRTLFKQKGKRRAGQELRKHREEGRKSKFGHFDKSAQ
jgi:hypothetical protein